MFINTNKTDERSLYLSNMRDTGIITQTSAFHCITVHARTYTSFYFVTTDLVAAKFVYIDGACSAMVLKGLFYMYVSLVVACCLQALICYKCPHIPNPIMKKAPA
jgi:hypothetical protein